MFRAILDDFWEVQLDKGRLWLYHSGKPVEVLEPEAVAKLTDFLTADHVQASTYNLKDEEGQPVSDEVVESSRD